MRVRVRVRVGGGGDSVDILIFRVVRFMSGDISDIGYYLMLTIGAHICGISIPHGSKNEKIAIVWFDLSADPQSSFPMPKN